MELSRRSLFKSLFGLGLTAVVGGRVTGKSEDRSQPSRAKRLPSGNDGDLTTNTSTNDSSTVILWIMEEQHIRQWVIPGSSPALSCRAVMRPMTTWRLDG